MKHNLRPIAILYGAGAYIAFFLLFTNLPQLVAPLFTSNEPRSGFDLGGPGFLLFFACLPLTFVLAPFLGGFITARAAKSRPYVHLCCVFVLSCGLLCLTGYGPSFNRKGEVRAYAIFLTLGILSSLAGAWFGWARSAEAEADELLETLRNIKP